MSNEKQKQDEINRTFLLECSNGNLTKVKELLTNDKICVDIHFRNDTGFRYACQEGHLELVRYLSCSPELKEHANITAFNNDAIYSATMKGQLEVVDFLLTYPALKQKLDIHMEQDKLFRLSCMYGHVELIQYLLHSSKLNDHIKTNKNHGNGSTVSLNNDENGFIIASKHGHDHVINYLVFEENIILTPAIEYHINNNSPQYRNFFIKRELNKKLEKILEPKENSFIKAKI